MHVQVGSVEIGMLSHDMLYLLANGNASLYLYAGSSSYLDVTNPEVRAWWATQFTPDKYQGSTKHLYIWNDMNEPSVFNGPEITMHKDVLHHNNVEHRCGHSMCVWGGAFVSGWGMGAPSPQILVGWGLRMVLVGIECRWSV